MLSEALLGNGSGVVCSSLSDSLRCARTPASPADGESGLNSCLRRARIGGTRNGQLSWLPLEAPEETRKDQNLEKSTEGRLRQGT